MRDNAAASAETETHTLCTNPDVAESVITRRRIAAVHQQLVQQNASAAVAAAAAAAVICASVPIYRPYGHALNIVQAASYTHSSAAGRCTRMLHALTHTPVERARRVQYSASMSADDVK